MFEVQVIFKEVLERKTGTVAQRASSGCCDMVTGWIQ